MDLITHAMTGFCLGTLAASRKNHLYPILLTATLAAALPDSDSVMYIINLELYRKYHRLYTENLFAVPLWAILGALPAWLWVRGRYLFFYLLALAAVLIHLGLDLLCDWPLFLLFPLSRKDFALYYVEYSSVPLLIAVTLLSLVILFIREKRQGNPITKE